MTTVLKFWKESWGANQTPYNKVKVSLPFTLNNKKALMRAIARNWGGIDREKTLHNDDRRLVMNFTCEGHGGMILFTTDPLPCWGDPNLSSEMFGLDDQWFIYTFEEDEQWAVLYTLLPLKARKKYAALSNNHYSDLNIAAQGIIEKTFKDIKSEIENDKSFFVLYSE